MQKVCNLVKCQTQPTVPQAIMCNCSLSSSAHPLECLMASCYAAEMRSLAAQPVKSLQAFWHGCETMKELFASDGEGCNAKLGWIGGASALCQALPR